MTNIEFVEVTSDLEKFFDKELKEFERLQWFQELKSMSVMKYRQIIKQTYRKCKFMPKLADIIAINEELVSIRSTTGTEIEKVHCKKCKCSGVIFYEKEYEGLKYTFIARCDCKNGLNYIYDGTQISDAKHRSKYYIPTVQQLNL